MTLASGAQKRKIWMLAGKNGMDEELLHAYIYSLVHKDSIRKLDIAEAVKVIDGLSGRDVRASNPRTEEMSYPQRRYICSLAIQLGWVDEKGDLDEDRLNRFCRKQYSTLYYRALNRSQACKCIEALKEMLHRQRLGVDVGGA